MRCATVLLALCTLFAEPISVQAVTIETVPVANAGNAPDVHNFREIGAVGYDYEIGKYEVTNAQYVEFLNVVDPAGANVLGLYDGMMTTDARGGVNFSAAAAGGNKYSVKSGRANNPVVFVDFFDAARFVNWLHNGQGTGNTEDGAYRLTGGIPYPTNGDVVVRRVTASWCLPTEDEWYKAGYHKNDGATGNYFDYPTATDQVPYSDQPPGSGAPNQANTANFKLSDGLANGYNDGYAVTGSNAFVAGTNYLTDVGAYTLADSPYGTFDQGGNVWEWTETQISAGISSRIVAGGSWINDPSYLEASAQNSVSPDTAAYTVGFRVARVEPGVLPGDYNGDGAVDAADYTIWRDTLDSFEDLRANGDDTGPSQGYIDQADYDVWKNNFGTIAGAGSLSDVTAVPEPTAQLLIFAAASLLVGPRTRQGRIRAA